MMRRLLVFFAAVSPVLAAVGCNLIADIQEGEPIETTSAGGSGATSQGGAGAGGGGGGPCTEGDERSCYTGPAGTEAVGVCSRGQQTCTGGKWGACEGETLPTDEACDALDNDCDGFTDEGCPCNDGDPCFPFPSSALPGKGNCKQGTIVCKDGQFAECQGAVGPAAETCNGFDDDCDGILDDVDGIGNACETGLPGVCQPGKLHCNIARRIIECAQQTQASAEECNSLDDDCNGVVDDLADTPCTLQVTTPSGQVQCDGDLACASNQAACSPSVFFFDDFSSSVSGGWSLDPEWGIGPTSAGPQPAQGNPDPPLDHTPSPDNGIAGVVIGGNLPDMVFFGSYLTSKQISTAGSSTLYLSYWRWLNASTSAETPHSVQVSANNGATWTPVWTNADGPIFDSQWVFVAYDLSAYAGQSIRIRFGVANMKTGAPSVSSWNVDDVLLSSCPAPN